ncbi:hypothetical protein RvVAT039_04390 [Agrobacterium vitis]|uniref:Methyl-accepting chemotaxis protein n=2 Tax=Rhizobium/Agrobacterium group TaxID=227290 RepID=B9JYE0_ALLAM|nr:MULTISPECIES: DUF3486 family protein [Rhizobium/Agrobacterium group]ACM37170.1 methyl-accepting chemotaxis protein [Allorhizobium ampelinum S4]MUO30010.1 DUF3486 family protein [Agrobacterium vitis]MUO42374.1 DUF3486 family protein [Agrobacterium vitis]MUP10712.1 DUF3486 family protein [Agrobacterium vitis]BCH63223.1 hypothetical protein RvVAT039_04390 [Agrobacterium vitis]
MAKGRGRLSSLQLLPRECSHVVQWAAEQLQDTTTSQVDIYQEFVTRLEQVQRESRGELEFKIPSLSSFNRYSVNLDELTRQINEAREMASAVASTFDAGKSDDLTLVATEAIKGLVLACARTKKGTIDPKGIAALAAAVHKAAQAQSVSSDRRRKVEAHFAEKAKEAVATVTKSKGLSAEAADEILAKILGVEK